MGPDDHPGRPENCWPRPGNQNAIARSEVPLGPLDIDAINVCATLDDGTSTVPETGALYVIADEGTSGAIKSFVGSFPRQDDQLPAQNASGMGLTRCEVDSVQVSPEELRESDVPEHAPIYIDGTEDPD